MSEEMNVEASENTSELETLKKRADLMGIQYRANIGIDKLKEKIQLKLGKEPEVKTKEPVGERNYLTEEEWLAKQKAQERKNIGKLVRIRVTCMNPAKKNWEGEIISVGSAKIGTFKKYVPFNAEQGWHVPQIIYEELKNRKCSVFYTVKGNNGDKVRKAKLVPEFSIELLDPLSPEELKDLAKQQAMAGTIG